MLTIDEAIKQNKEAAKKLRRIAEGYNDDLEYAKEGRTGRGQVWYFESKIEDCIRDAEEHEQLAKWLEELKIINCWREIDKELDSLMTRLSDDMKSEQKVSDCRKCQWIWLSEKGDKYDKEGSIFCDNGDSHNCGRYLGTINDYSDVIDVGCDNWEEPI